MGHHVMFVTVLLAYCFTTIRTEQEKQCHLAPPEITDRSARFCPFIDKCPSGFTAAFTARGCFCDPNCALYGDCCSEYTTKADVEPLAKEIFNCRKVNGVWSNNAPIYIVDRCPSAWGNEDIRKQCEQATDGHLLNWPLSDDRNVTYKNLFCVLCNDMALSEVKYWKSNIFCSEGLNNTSVKELLTKGALSSCNLTFLHPRDEQHIRNCKEIVDFCPPNWNDNCTKRMCESPTATVQYRYTSAPIDRTFKNPYCALCHGSNVTCEDIVSKKFYSAKLYSQVYGREYALTISIDMNTGQIITKRQGAADQVQNMTSCAVEHVYDPFSDLCKATSLTSWTLVVQPPHVGSTTRPSSGGNRRSVSELVLWCLILLPTLLCS